MLISTLMRHTWGKIPPDWPAASCQLQLGLEQLLTSKTSTFHVVDNFPLALVGGFFFVRGYKCCPVIILS